MNDSYKIIVEGHLDRDWSEWFGGLTVSYTEQGETVLSGQIIDQPALIGLLNKLLDLGLVLISVNGD